MSIDHFKLFFAVNILDLKRRLRLDLAPESRWLIQGVMIYNCLIWLLFTWQHRARFRRYLGNTPKRPLSWFTEINYLFLKDFNPKDAEYYEYRRQYRVYLGFLIILLTAAYIVFLPATWTMQLHVRLPSYLLAYGY
jgi:hypothetical protein